MHLPSPAMTKSIKQLGVRLFRIEYYDGTVITVRRKSKLDRGNDRVCEYCCIPDYAPKEKDAAVFGTIKYHCPAYNKHYPASKYLCDAGQPPDDTYLELVDPLYADLLHVKESKDGDTTNNDETEGYKRVQRYTPPANRRSGRLGS